MAEKLSVLSRLGSRGGRVLPYMGYIGMCGPNGYIHTYIHTYTLFKHGKNISYKLRMITSH